MKHLPTPTFVDFTKKDHVYRINYAGIANDALAFKQAHGVSNSKTDKLKVAVMMIDAQNTFCIPGFELFVQGAPDDNERLARFLYTNARYITKMIPTMDTHIAMQIFHPSFWNDAAGNTVSDYTQIGLDDLNNGTYVVNPATVAALDRGYAQVTSYARSYVESLEKKGKNKLMIWPYHAMMTGIGHALVSVVEEAIHFHGILRNSNPDIRIKGGHPLTENYSVIEPEVTTYEHNGTTIVIAPSSGAAFVQTLMEYDVVIIAGQAKSHCVAWTIEDMLRNIATKDPALAQKVYLLDDCTSPVVTPAYDFTNDANAAFARFAQAGMHIVQSTTPMDQWPGIDATKLV
jgi:nicotinamidase-related amidase